MAGKKADTKRRAKRRPKATGGFPSPRQREMLESARQFREKHPTIYKVS